MKFSTDHIFYTFKSFNEYIEHEFQSGNIARIEELYFNETDFNIFKIEQKRVEEKFKVLLDQARNQLFNSHKLFNGLNCVRKKTK